MADADSNIFALKIVEIAAFGVCLRAIISQQNAIRIDKRRYPTKMRFLGSMKGATRSDI
ncbi:MAG: hypothetical protein ACPHZ5_08665 [Candidatus Puniceispirillum sp.]